MRDLAEFIMRGPKQAAIVAFVSTLIPMMFWLGAAAIALVTLRQGPQQGMSTLVWAIIPALGWWLGMHDPGALIVLAGALVMATVLRATISWDATFLAGMTFSLFVGWMTPLLMPELINTLMEMADEVFRSLAQDAQMEYDEGVQSSFRAMMVASFAASFFGMALGSICLARSWQSRLYNPGGWQQEFHQLRMNPKLVFGFLMLLWLAPAIGLEPILILMVLGIPVILCGLALVHGVIGRKKLGGQWLFGFYFLVVMLFPTVLVLLALIALLDSVIDIRSRIQTA